MKTFMQRRQVFVLLVLAGFSIGLGSYEAFASGAYIDPTKMKKKNADGTPAAAASGVPGEEEKKADRREGLKNALLKKK